MKEVVLGIDIGGTFTKFGFVDLHGEILDEGSIPSDEHIDINLFIQDLKMAVDARMPAGKYKIKGVGIGAPNGNYYNGTIEFAPNLKWKGVINLVQLFRNAFGVPAVVTNDANAAAMGEMLYGGAREMKNFIMITLGTGLGSGIVANGQMIYGHDGFAGELGHVTVDTNGRKCGCGRRGCLETYVSVTGIERTVFEMLGKETEESELRNYSFHELDALMISKAAENGDKLAKKAFDETGRILGLKLADAMAHTSPEAIFLFGGLAGAGDLILKPVRKYFEKYVLRVYRGKVSIQLSALQGKNIAVLGAAALMWNELA
ncbi:MAG: ROK family protein [Bacteroidales bacterium]|nr:ROK family protein [Bacteroidales bacterium]